MQGRANQESLLDCSDSELARLTAAGNELACREIMRQNNRRLYRIARSILRDDGEAEDAVQEAYCRAFTSLDSFRGESSLSTWLTRIVLNEALGRVRVNRAARKTPLPEEAQIIPFPLIARDDPERTMAQGQIRYLVEQAIDELPEPFRLVLVSRVLEGMSVEETAEVLALRPETVKTRLHRARSMLRDQLEKKIGPTLLDAFPFGGTRCERLTERIIQSLGFR